MSSGAKPLAVYRNAAEALVGSVWNILQYGTEVTVRGSTTRELTEQCFQITHPLERCVVVPHRHNSIFATIAESAWVVAGRNDLTFLSRYLPQAPTFSDDGEVWRAGYGPRLRDWHGVDQVREVFELLKKDSASRRAVMAIFDPEADFHPSKDIPCNNWLHWTIRDGCLHVSIVIRSNDIIWGFSGINSFEWSLLQEMLACWLGVKVGAQTYFVGSQHFYERHNGRAGRIASPGNGDICYITQPMQVAYDDTFYAFDRHMLRWFALEERLRTEDVPDRILDAYPEPLFRSYLYMLRAYWLLQQGETGKQCMRSLESLEGTDLHHAANEYFARKDKKQ